MLITAVSQVTADRYDGPGPWWPIVPIVWLVLVVSFVFLAARFGWRGRRRWYDEQSANDGRRSGESRLAERFAAGEIAEEEYRTRLAVLQETSSSEDKR